MLFVSGFCAIQNPGVDQPRPRDRYHDRQSDNKIPCPPVNCLYLLTPTAT